MSKNIEQIPRLPLLSLRNTTKYVETLDFSLVYRLISSTPTTDFGINDNDKIVLHSLS